MFDDDARDPEQLIETPADLAEALRVIRLGKMIQAIAERRRQPGKPEPVPRSLGG